MARKSKVSYSAGGLSIPNFKEIKPDMQVHTVAGIKRDYKRAMWEAEYYVHNEVADKKLAAEFVKYCAREFGKDEAASIKGLPDFKLSTPGKYAYIANKGAILSPTVKDAIVNYYTALLKEATAIVPEVKDDAPKTTAVVISVQDRMREQLEDLLGSFEAVIDDWAAGNDVSKFDPYKEMLSYKIEVKPGHAKIVKDSFTTGTEEAAVLVAWDDDDIKEAYAYTTAKQRKALVALYEKINVACDTLINTGKAVRKQRTPKAPSKEKLVAKVKYKASEPALGLASINPVNIVGASVLWVYNTKNRKLVKVVADSMTGPLGVKGTTIIGFDEVKSVQKTVRKPELLKGSDKLARTKFDKLYEQFKAVEVKFNGRLNEHCVLIKTF